MGLVAICSWGALAALIVAAHGLPPLQMVGMAFCVATAVIAVLVTWRRGWARVRQPPAALALGVFGLFGEHALYFSAIKLTAPAEASLIAYLWPLLIVLFAGRVRARQLGGAAMGLLGTMLLIGAGGTIGPARWLGDGLALATALTWSSYSVMNRRFSGVPSEAILGTCATVAALGIGCHFAFEPTILPNARQFAAVVALGLGPTGLAFVAWDHATKHGDLPLLGALSYLAPLLSTALLVATGISAPSWTLPAACLLIVGGAAIASLKTGSARNPVPSAP